MIDIDNAEVVRINGSEQRGGWECVLRVTQDTDILEINQHVVLTWRGGFSGPPGIIRTAFDGNVMSARTQFDRPTSVVDIVAQTTDGAIREYGWLQGLGLADTAADPRDHYHQWDSVTGGGAAERLTIGRIIRHIMGFYDSLGVPPASNPDWVAHTNLVHHPVHNPNGWVSLSKVETVPFNAAANPGGTMRVNRINVHQTSNLWSRMRELAHYEFFHLYFDKSDTLHYERHPMFQAVLPIPVMTFDEDFCLGQPVVEDRANKRIEQVRFAAVTDEGDVLHSNYPASPVYVYGNVPQEDKLRCNDQNTLDSWAQRVYLFENRDYTVKWTVPGLCGLLFEILDRVRVTYSGTTKNGVHYSWNQKKFWIHDITVTPDNMFGGVTEFTLEAENA